MIDQLLVSIQTHSHTLIVCLRFNISSSTTFDGLCQPTKTTAINTRKQQVCGQINRPYYVIISAQLDNELNNYDVIQLISIYVY